MSPIKRISITCLALAGLLAVMAQPASAQPAPSGALAANAVAAASVEAGGNGYVVPANQADVVEQRAKALVGSRFGELRYATDQASLIVTVSNLAAGEAAALAAELSLIAPTTVTATSLAPLGTGASATSRVVEPFEGVGDAPLKPGKLLYMNRSGARCTAGALVKKGSVQYGLTAGHCGLNGWAVSLGSPSNVISSVATSTWSSSSYTISADAAIFAAPSNAQAAVYAGGSASLPIVGQAQPRQGQYLCVRGAVSNRESCGTVISPQDTSMTVNGRSHLVTGMAFLVLSTGKVCKGDSGGPIYQKLANGNVLLVGVLNAATPDASGTCGDSYVGFTPINAALSATGSTLVVSSGVALNPPSQALSTPFTQIVVTPDMTSDGYDDILAVDRNGILALYTGGSTGLKGPYQVGWGWKPLTVLAPGDWNGDGKADVIAVDSAGKMYLYPGQGGGILGGKTEIGHGWNPFIPKAAGDLNSDGKNDLLAIERSTGYLYLYPGTGGGGFKARSKVGHGWSASGLQLYGSRDLNSDGRADILATNASGQLMFYKGTGSGTFNTAVQVGQGWNTYTLLAGGDLNGDGRKDILGVDSSRKLFLYPGKGNGTFGTKSQIGRGW
ncbi:MAG: FG-GAP-like repeat-containing protein [Bifidobacteriaceae bacterium]|jgi:hypothetical protein|nr:FG-GAP-like repeat-containing protein [Bifidobacteriaceae bacterium]